MALKFFDTYRRSKVSFEPLRPGEVGMYNCGPTVYDYAHIGNFRAYVFADLLRRWLEVRGFKVRQVMNLTDVDDKTIRRSRELGLSLSEFTGRYITAFREDVARMNILPAEVYPPATGHIEEMVALIQALLEKGHAYRSEDGSIYFRIESFPDYGNLSGKRLTDLRIGLRVSSDEYESKDDVRDFALWKAWSEEDGDVFWETPLGKGRPGWHIECSAMSMKYLGETFDIHTGGVDNIFPHHENEIAQSRCATGGEFARYWLHCEYLIVDGKKMSKSLGNYFTIRDLVEKGWSPREIRYVLAGAHYRSQLNFTFEGLKAARSALERLDDFRESWRSFGGGENTGEAIEILADADRRFGEAMDDDLSVGRALAAVFEFVRQVNNLFAHGVKVTSSDRDRFTETWQRWDHALGFLLPFGDDTEPDDVDVNWIEERIARRNAARKAKNWAEADSIRDELAEAGIVIKDGPDGSTWKKR